MFAIPSSAKSRSRLGIAPKLGNAVRTRGLDAATPSKSASGKTRDVSFGFGRDPSDSISDFDAEEHYGNMDVDVYKTRNFQQESKDDNDQDPDTSFESYFDKDALAAKIEHSPRPTSPHTPHALAHALTSRLTPALSSHGLALRNDLATTIAPAARRVRDVHDVLEGRVDGAFGYGVLSFDDACKAVERVAVRDEDELKRVYSETQRNVLALIERLQESYKARDALWDNLRADVERSASSTLSTLSETPTVLDERIKALEKKARDVGAGKAVAGMGDWDEDEVGVGKRVERGGVVKGKGKGKGGGKGKEKGGRGKADTKPRGGDGERTRMIREILEGL